MPAQNIDLESRTILEGRMTQMQGSGIMKPLQTIIYWLWDKLFVVAGTLCVLLPMSPLNTRYIINRDSGVFLYVGWRILNGELPYRDVWDHKPPVIFYIDALGLAIANGSRWGVWVLEFLSLSFAAFVGYKVIQKALGTIPAVLSTLLWLLTLVFLIQGGNLTTEYTLSLQFATLWLVTTTLEKPTFHYWRWFFIGLIGAMAFFTKQTTIGIWVTAILVLIINRVKLRKVKELAFESLYFFGGVVAVCIFWIVFFALQGGLAEFLDAAFFYNFIYSSSVTDFADRILPVTKGIAPLTTVGLLQIAGVGYILGLLLISFRRDVSRSWLPLLVIGLFDLPIELILISISGRKYGHYYMTTLPVLAFFAGITFWTILSAKFLHDLPRTAKYVLTVGLVGVFLWTSYKPYVEKVLSFRGVRKPAVVSGITQNTNPEDKILLWGAESSVNFVTRRKSPTRFVYLYPLYMKGYVNEQMIIEFLDGLVRERPVLIIDTHNELTPLYKFPIQTSAIQQRIAYLQCHYRAVGNVQVGNVQACDVRDWTVYEYTAGNCYP